MTIVTMKVRTINHRWVKQYLLPPLSTGWRPHHSLRSSADHRRLLTTTSSAPTDAERESSPSEIQAKQVMLRFYRILQRQCSEWEQQMLSSSSSSTTLKVSAALHEKGFSSRSSSQRTASSLSSKIKKQQQARPFLLQPHLDPFRAGGPKTVESETQASLESILWFFCQCTMASTRTLVDQESTQHDQSLRMMVRWFRQMCPDASVEWWDDDEEEALAEIALARKGEIHSRWTTLPAIRQAIRYAFRSTWDPSDDYDTDIFPLIMSSSTSPSTTFYDRQRAVAAYQVLSAQRQLHRLTSYSWGEHGVKVSATSRCIGRSWNTSTSPKSSSNPSSTMHSTEVGNSSDSSTNRSRTIYKYRFAYRIRIENASPDRTVQLLGRTWHIQPAVATASSSSTIPPELAEPIRVHAPQNGAVGKLPVLQPGEAFVYISGAELPCSGWMQGAFHLAVVPRDTPSAAVGTQVPAFESDQRFQVEVQPFPLQVDENAEFVPG